MSWNGFCDPSSFGCFLFELRAIEKGRRSFFVRVFLIQSGHSGLAEAALSSASNT